MTAVFLFDKLTQPYNSSCINFYALPWKQSIVHGKNSG